MALIETSHNRLLQPDEGKRRRLTPIEEARQQFGILGVAVFILKNGKIFTVQENRTNTLTGKKGGEQGIFCETLQKDETFEDAALRCLREEAGVPKDRIGELFSIEQSTSCLGEGEASGVFGRGYQVELVGSEAEFRGHITNGDGEITPIGFLSLQDLRMRRLRRATRVALELYVPVRDATARALAPLSVENLKTTY